MKFLRKEQIITLLLIFTGIGPVMLKGQQPYTLEQAIDTALAKHAALKSSEVAVKIASEQLSADNTTKIPEIYSTISLQRNLIIPSTPVPLAVIQGAGNSSDLTFIKFGTDWQSGIGLNLNYDIFNPDRRQQLINSESNSKIATLDYKAKKSSLKTSVFKAYAEAVLAEQQLRYAVDDTLLSFNELQVAINRAKQGRITEQDLNSAKLQRNKSLSSYSQALNISRQARIELAYQMGMNPEKEALPEASDSLGLLLKKIDGSMDAPLDPTASIGYLKLLTRSEQDSLLLNNTRRKILPTVSLNAAYGTNYYENTLALFNTNYWYGNSFVGLSVNIPLTRDISSYHLTEADKLQLDRNRYNMQDYLNRKKADIEKTLSDINHNLQEMNKNDRDMELARQNLAAARSLFIEGRSLPSDLQQAQYAYGTSRVDYLQSVYNYILAKLTLRDLLKTE